MENIPSSAIMMIAGVIITALFLGFSFGMANYGRDMGNESLRQKEDTVLALSDGEMNQYIGREMTGVQIYSLIEKWHGTGATIRVKTKVGYVTFSDDTDLAEELKNAKASIPLTAVYKGTEINNTLNDIIGIQFDFSN